MRHGINITTNQRLSPSIWGNGNTIIVGDSQTSPLPIFSEGGGTSVHRLQFVVFTDPDPDYRNPASLLVRPLNSMVYLGGFPVLYV